MSVEVVYKNSANLITLEQAIKCYENGISVAVNDGKDVTITIEKEPTSLPAN